MKLCSCILLSGGLLLFTFACKNKQEPRASENPGIEAPTVAAEKPEQTVTNWTTAHTEADSAALLKLYGDTVWYYGHKMSGKAVAAAKMKALRQQPGYRQQTESLVAQMTGDTAVISFQKLSYYKGAEKRIPASLQLLKQGQGWRIIAESDSATDALVARFKNMKIPEGAVEGDFDGDGTREFVWMVAPKISETEMECDGPCTATLKFSSPFIAPITVKDCIGGDPDNLGDLDGNGSDEIGMVHDWFTSCWKAYYVFTLKNNKWVHLVPAISTHCILRDEGTKIVEKDPAKPGYITIRYSEMTEDSIATKAKSVRVR